MSVRWRGDACGPPVPLSAVCILRPPVGFPGGSVVKNPPASAGDLGSPPGSGRSPGGGNGNPLQHFLGDLMDRGDRRAAVHGVAKESHMTLCPNNTTVHFKKRKGNLGSSLAVLGFCPLTAKGVSSIRSPGTMIAPARRCSPCSPPTKRKCYKET